MSNIDKRVLREAAEKATPGRIGDRIDGSGSIKYLCFGNDGSLVLQTDHKNMEYGFIGENSEADELFFRMCDPATVLALLDELEAKDSRINRLEAIVDVAEQRNALMREWKRALKVPCDLVDNQVPIVIHGMTIRLDKLKETEAKLEAAEKRIAELEALAFSPALLDVIAERQRQMSVEGWTPKHDDKHDNNELAFAASCYAFHSAAASWDFEDDGTPYDIHPAPKHWPWSPEWWKPKNPRRDLVKAGALILAEIERIDRAAAGKGE
ncbi:TPA: ead/Ea22-like family protein [Escherichia coli]|uniref:ead/Ea22-like family protein n=1 Tax=Enterobacteriaceae TaxID=543 RepID=UPI000A37850D|nr:MULTISPECIES: ead/Ea22-like family protein [Enterobacteriaceae]EFN3714793.1 ead/Ea22-like family protein [Escherichia coli]EFN9967320.1 ead/Ea22-like family protein [Escherichia coli]EGF4729403.1 ead/Ea22-like family protein [Escherichia coli]EGG1048087.1 ead/Ea22-like family protein [Escherichia coli]EGM8377227.1 ead/Ea22-like family protein [Escherichia coli]